MPLTEYQAKLAQRLAQSRSPNSYLAGGAALHIEPNTLRYSNDLDYFNDSETRVAKAYADDLGQLEQHGYQVTVDLQQPGYIRAQVMKDGEATKIEWAHDSAWRFLPTIHNDLCGYQLHPLDLATNKVLALAGRDEARDFLDVIYVHHEILPLGALCWAAAGKDPGFTPMSLLALLRRRGKYRPEDFRRLRLAREVNLSELKSQWLAALDEAEAFVSTRPMEDIGCLYYDKDKNTFVQPTREQDVERHFGRPGGVLPVFETIAS